MTGLNLRLREILTVLPSTDDASDIAPAVPALAETWHDSTLELERGLEVRELAVEPTEPARKVDKLA